MSLRDTRRSNHAAMCRERRDIGSGILRIVPSSICRQKQEWPLPRGLELRNHASSQIRQWRCRATRLILQFHYVVFLRRPFLDSGHCLFGKTEMTDTEDQILRTLSRTAIIQSNGLLILDIYGVSRRRIVFAISTRRERITACTLIAMLNTTGESRSHLLRLDPSLLPRA